MSWDDKDKEKLFLILEKIYIAQEQTLRLFRQYDSEYHHDIETKEGNFNEKLE